MRRRALISVTNKRNLHLFKALTDTDLWEIISTGGTEKALTELGIPCTPVEQITGFPEMLDGRLKTLHPNLFGGTLADRSKPKHLQKIAEHGISPIDLVVVNLYNFAGKPGIENIDIGGPSHLRAAAKNASSVTVVVDPDDYMQVIREIITTGDSLPKTRESLALKVFEHTARYDRQIYEWMLEEFRAGRSVFAVPETAPTH